MSHKVSPKKILNLQGLTAGLTNENANDRLDELGERIVEADIDPRVDKEMVLWLITKLCNWAEKNGIQVLKDAGPQEGENSFTSGLITQNLEPKHGTH